METKGIGQLIEKNPLRVILFLLGLMLLFFALGSQLAYDKANHTANLEKEKYIKEFCNNNFGGFNDYGFEYNYTKRIIS